MNALYVGILTDGTTSKMRADTLRSLLPAAQWTLADTDKGFSDAPRVWKTMAFRLKSGPLVNRINHRVIEQTGKEKYDLVWVDKAVYLWESTVMQLRQKTDCLVHFTPDTAFYANRSRHFCTSASKFDLLVTTKTFELDEYAGIADKNRVFLTTQAFDAGLHRPLGSNASKKPVAVFIGLCEPDREACMAALLNEGVPVRLGGKGWEKFLKRYSAMSGLHYLGDSVFGQDYVEEYASASIGLGLLSKRFPELHTTRTFEIPACGTLLATERTPDAVSFFDEDEALFFDNYAELAQQISGLLSDSKKIEAISRKGHQRVLADGRDYASVLSGVLQRLAANS